MVQDRIHPPPTVTTPRLAPWDHVEELCRKLDTLIALLKEGVVPPAPPPEWPGWEPITSKLDEILSQLKELKITATVPWEAKDVEEIFNRAIRAAGTFYTDRMADWTKGKRLLLRVNSSLDQAVQIQVIGNIGNTKDLATDINTPKPCAAGGKLSIGLAWDDWHPYIGCEITVAVAPTAGILTISSVIQE